MYQSSVQVDLPREAEHLSVYEISRIAAEQHWLRSALLERRTRRARRPFRFARRVSARVRAVVHLA